MALLALCKSQLNQSGYSELCYHVLDVPNVFWAGHIRFLMSEVQHLFDVLSGLDVLNQVEVDEMNGSFLYLQFCEIRWHCQNFAVLV